MSVPPSHHLSKNRLEALSPRYADLKTQFLQSEWGLKLYEPDPSIYDPWHDALHRGKAPHNLMLKIFEHAQKKHWIKRGDLVLDPFGGSGRTGIVGSIMGHPVTLLEIEPIHARQTMPANITFAKHKCRALWTHDPSVIEGDARFTDFADNSFSAVITSPPYADQIDTGSNEATVRALGGRHGQEPSTIGTLNGYGKTEGQIGILKVGVRSKRRESYEEAMAKVYAELYRITKPGGILVTIIKDGIKNERKLPLNRISRKLIYAVGWNLLDAKLVEVNVPKQEENDLFGNPSEPKIVGHRVSYFRRWHYKRNPKSLIRYEHVTFFIKPHDANGNGHPHLNGNGHSKVIGESLNGITINGVPLSTTVNGYPKPRSKGADKQITLV